MADAEFKIDKGVPIPRAKGGRSNYPWHDMEVGDSFFAANRRGNLAAHPNRHMKPRRFSSRTVTENGVRGVRIWRVE